MDYTLNPKVPLTAVQNEVVEKLHLNYNLTFEYVPQLKSTSYKLLMNLNNISHGKVLSYNFHTRDTEVQCNKTGLIYHARPERVLDHCYCRLCNSKRISDNTRKAMNSKEVKAKLDRENNSIEHKLRFRENKHKGGTLVPTRTEEFVMDFMLSKGFIWNEKIILNNHNDKGLPNYYKPDFINHEFKIVVELDGSSHSYDVQKKVDERKDNYFRSQGYKVYRFYNGYVLSNYNYFQDIINDIIKGGGDLYDRLYIK